MTTPGLEPKAKRALNTKGNKMQIINIKREQFTRWYQDYHVKTVKRLISLQEMVMGTTIERKKEEKFMVFKDDLSAECNFPSPFAFRVRINSDNHKPAWTTIVSEQLYNQYIDYVTRNQPPRLNEYSQCFLQQRIEQQEEDEEALVPEETPPDPKKILKGVIFSSIIILLVFGFVIVMFAIDRYDPLINPRTSFFGTIRDFWNNIHFSR